MTRRWLIGTAVIVLLAASVTIDRPRSVHAATFPDHLVWLALGDSYSSGEGLRYIDTDANPPGKTCERASGRSTVNSGQGSRAWAAVAYDTLRGDMVDSQFKLLACTGAISNEIHDQYKEWTGNGGPTADLVTFSMGGNNLGFKDVLMRCIGLSTDNSTGAGIILNPAIGCDTTEKEMKAKVDQLVGTSGVGPDGGQTLRDMYQELAENAVTHGGHVLVAGYPNIVEESGRWSLGWLEGNRCSRIRRSDTAMLRSVTGYFNQQIANLVHEVDGKYNGVHFHWLDVSQVYESAGGRHGLCTGDPWINGITTGFQGPHTGDIWLRFARSFHPNQKGHDATGAAVAAMIEDFDWTTLERLDTTTPTIEQTPSSVRLGDSGDDVLAVQQALIDRGFTLDLDGSFGERTDGAVRAFQGLVGLQVDGVVGPESRAALGVGEHRTSQFRTREAYLQAVSSYLQGGSGDGLPADAITSLRPLIDRTVPADYFPDPWGAAPNGGTLEVVVIMAGAALDVEFCLGPAPDYEWCGIWSVFGD